MGKNQRQFKDSLRSNNQDWLLYFNRLMELSISMFEWTGLPDTVDARYLELTLFTDGQAIFFEDEEIGPLCLQCAIGGELNVYRVPTNRRAIADNGYNKPLTNKDSVIIWNNMLRQNSALPVIDFSRKLYDIDQTIIINAKAQKTPILINCNEKQRLSLENVYMKYEGNQPFIFGNKDLDISAFNVLKTDAPYVADKLYTLKSQIWHEALTYLGISNTNTNKKERLISDEVNRNMGDVVASRFSRLNARKQAAEEINRMFGLNIDCKYRDVITPEGIEISEVANNE